MTDKDEDLVIRLSPDEALVLFNWLHRARVERLLPQVTTDDAEVVALSGLCRLLQRKLIDPVSEEYPRLVQGARQRLRRHSA